MYRPRVPSVHTTLAMDLLYCKTMFCLLTLYCSYWYQEVPILTSESSVFKDKSKHKRSDIRIDEVEPAIRTKNLFKDYDNKSSSSSSSSVEFIGAAVDVQRVEEVFSSSRIYEKGTKVDVAMTPIKKDASSRVNSNGGTSSGGIPMNMEEIDLLDESLDSDDELIVLDTTADTVYCNPIWKDGCGATTPLTSRRCSGCKTRIWTKRSPTDGQRFHLGQQIAFFRCHTGLLDGGVVVRVLSANSVRVKV